MKLREEIFEHPEWWQTNVPISDLNETDEEFNNRIAYLRYIEPNPRAVNEVFFENKRYEYETIDEYRARLREYYLSIDMDVDEKCQDCYYLDEENIKNDMLGNQIYFDKEWFHNYIKKTNTN